MRFMLSFLVIGLALGSSGLLAGADAESDFNKAYYLENEKGELEEAGRLYREVAQSPDTPAELGKRAEKRLAVLQERLRSRELARLVPNNALAYLEIRRPAEHLANLLKLAGFLGSEEGAAGAPGRTPVVAVSPRLLKAIQQIDGAALAITDINPQGPPQGIFILHCGRSDLVQGLIETALSGGTAADALQPGEPVEGCPAYDSPIGVIVTTGELAIAANPRELAADAIRRLRQDGQSSLFEVPAFAELRARNQASFAFGFVNGQRALEMGHAAMSRNGKLPPEYAMAQAIGDIESLEWLALEVGTREEGLAAKLSLRLKDGNHCLPYHLLRTPQINRDAMRALPPGAALALGLGLGLPGGSDTAAIDRSQAAAAFTGLDLGREIFSNVNSILVHVEPEAADAQPQGLPGPIPDAGIIFLVKDASRSEALWKELLRVSSTLLQVEPNSARPIEMEGAAAQAFKFPGDFQVFMATLPGSLVLATSERALAASIKSARGGESLLVDPAMARLLQDLDPEASKFLAAHGGRLFQLAQQWAHMSGDEAALIASLLERTTLSFSSRETPGRLDVNLMVSAPGIGPVIQKLISMENGRGRSRRPPEAAPARKPARVEAELFKSPGQPSAPSRKSAPRPPRAE